MSDGPFTVTTHCNADPSDGVVLFPPGKDPPKGARVLVTTTGKQQQQKKKKIALRGRKRSDAGAEGLCVSQASIDKLGGSGVLVNVRGLCLPVAVFHDFGLFLNVLLAILTSVLAILTALTGYTSVGPKDPTLLLKLAPWLLSLGFVVAIVTLAKDLKEA
jgi:hypothetical protein